MRKISALGLLAVAGLATTASARPVYVGGGFAIPDNNAAGASNTINVPDAFSITDMSVTINWSTVVSGAGSGHTWIGDIIATLKGPNNVTIDLMRRVGSGTATGVGDSSDLRGALTFSDSAPATTLWAAALAAGSTVSVAPGTYRSSTNIFNGNTITSYQATSLLGAFGGSGSLGAWQLFISDNAGGDTGTVVSWSLDLVPTPGAATMLGLAGLVGLRRRR